MKAISQLQGDLPVFQFVPIGARPVSGHFLKQPGFTLSLQVFPYTNNIPPKAA